MELEIAGLVDGSCMKIPIPTKLQMLGEWHRFLKEQEGSFFYRLKPPFKLNGLVSVCGDLVVFAERSQGARGMDGYFTSIRDAVHIGHLQFPSCDGTYLQTGGPSARPINAAFSVSNRQRD